MKSIIVLFLMFFFVLFLSAQEVSQIIEFDLNTTTDYDHIVLYDVNATYCVLKVNSNDFSLSNGFAYSNSEAHSVLLFCDANLNVIWYKTVKSDNNQSEIDDVVLGLNSMYLSGYANDIWFIEDSNEVYNGTVVGKIDFDGSIEWVRSYKGLQHNYVLNETLAIDSEENVILGTRLWNYEHPSQPDSLFFASDTCYCGAVAFQYALCTTTLVWDTDGNELWYHVLNSGHPSTVADVGIDGNDNYYVSGSNGWSQDPALFAGMEINGGSFVLSFAPDGMERWVYYMSDQVPSWNSTIPRYLFDDAQSVYLSVIHNDNLVVTGNDTLAFEIPTSGFVDYHTIHQTDRESGELIDVDLFGNFSQFDQIHAKEQGVPYMISTPHPDFTHSFPPYSYEPNPPEGLVLSKEPFGAYSEPVTLSLLQGASGSHIASDLIYLELQHNDEPISFTLDGIEYTTGTSNCVVVLDMSNDVQQEAQEEEIVLYPNPNVDNILMVHTDRPILKIELLDLQGKVALRSLQPMGQVNVSSLDPGVYIARIYSSHVVHSERFVVIDK